MYCRIVFYFGNLFLVYACRHALLHCVNFLCYCRIPERLVFIGGMVIMAMGCAVWLPYAGHPKMGESGYK